jgi:hypothetical protein
VTGLKKRKLAKKHERENEKTNREGHRDAVRVAARGTATWGMSASSCRFVLTARHRRRGW